MSEWVVFLAIFGITVRKIAVGGVDCGLENVTAFPYFGITGQNFGNTGQNFGITGQKWSQFQENSGSNLSKLSMKGN